MRCRRFFVAGALALGLAAFAAAEFTGPTPLAWRWAHPTTVSPNGVPAVRGDSLFVAVGNRVFSLDRATGNQRWRFPIADPIPGSFRSAPVVAGDVVVAAADNRFMYGIDAATGQSRWQYISEVPFVGQPVVAGNLVVIQRSDNRLLAVNSETGAAAWAAPYNVFDGIQGQLASYQNLVLYFTNANMLVALNAATLNIAWSRRFSVVMPESQPIVFGDNVFVNTGTFVVSLGAGNGAVRWQAQTGEQLAFSPAVSPVGVVTAVSRDGRVFFIDSATGRVNRNQTLDLGTILVARPTAADGKFVYPTSNGALNVVDPANGQLIWSYLIRPMPQRGGSAAGGGMGGFDGGGPMGMMGGPGGGGRPGGPAGAAAGAGGPPRPGAATPAVIAVPAAGPAILVDGTLMVLAQDGSLLAFDSRTGVDLTPPTVRMVWPNPGEEVSGQPPLELVFRIEDEASGVKDSSLKIEINGEEVRAELGRDGFATVRFSLTGENRPLTDGRKTIRVTVSDWMGNQTVAEFALIVDNTLRPLVRPTGPTTPTPGGGRPPF
ncbi:MAG: PQQ-binding-like beta-propeller repeat protein [Fimbriimonadaceae bacterium]